MVKEKKMGMQGSSGSSLEEAFEPSESVINGGTYLHCILVVFVWGILVNGNNAIVL